MNILSLIKTAVTFRDKRDWKRFHTPKDSALALISESGELVDHFKWHTEDEMNEYLKNHKKQLGEDLAGVLFWILLMSHDMDIDIVESFKEKIKKNEEKYPIERWKSVHVRK